MPSSPRVLIATTSRWFSAARLAASFNRNGCFVQAVCPSRHPLGLTTATSECFDFNPLKPYQSLSQAIERSAPDLIVPSDDLAASHLRHMYTALAALANSDGHGPDLGTPPDLAKDQEPWVSQLSRPRSRMTPSALMHLLRASLGDPASFPIIDSRSGFLRLSREEGVRTPRSSDLHCGLDITDWCKSYGLPAVLKADGCWGRRGVKIAGSLRQAISAFYTLRSPFSVPVVLKRAIVDRDLNPVAPVLKRTRPAVSVHQHIQGAEFNISVACWKGEVVASSAVEVLERAPRGGPVTRIRVVSGGDMLHAAERIARRLGLTGICGFDFLVEDGTGLHYLNEINTRAPHTGQLAPAPGDELPATLAQRLCAEPDGLTGRAAERAEFLSSREITMFPAHAAAQTSQSMASFPHPASLQTHPATYQEAH